jgi:predicted O-methyltransferase YrrM
MLSEIRARAAGWAVRWLMPVPLAARHCLYSAVASADDQPGAPSGRLLELVPEVIQRAAATNLESVSVRMRVPPHYPDVWPGEHYKLLAALVGKLGPAVVVEVGTATGLSALAILSTLRPGARLVTFDIVPWDSFADTVLSPREFRNGRLVQVVGNLAEQDVFESNRRTLEEAELIFVDGPKDVLFERTFLGRLGSIQFDAPPVVVLDDIRTWNMLRIWREIARPKLDMTSFGHWSGTGFIDWS